MKLSIYRRYRIGWVTWELHRHPAPRCSFISFGVGHPMRHAWWAMIINLSW